MNNPQHYLNQLKFILKNHFNLAELRELCFDSDISFEELPEGGKTKKIIELLELAHRVSKLDALVLNAKKAREGVNIFWPARDAIQFSNPYQGLSSFTESQAHLFFGRETLSSQLIKSVKTQVVNVILGASGSGKSSLVNAGILPRLEAEEIQFVRMRPGSNPFRSLALAVQKLEADADDEQLESVLNVM